MEGKIPHCGEIWMAEIAKMGGSVQYGYRPVFIISNNRSNAGSTIVNIIPITSKVRKRSPVHVDIFDYWKFGLKMPSMLLIEQIMTVSSESLDRKIGYIDDAVILKDIKDAMSIQFPLIMS